MLLKCVWIKESIPHKNNPENNHNRKSQDENMYDDTNINTQINIDTGMLQNSRVSQ